jgi:hypothetical protein
MKIAARGAVYGLVTFCSMFVASPASAVTMTFGAAKDATLYESVTGSLSGGGEDGFFAGRTVQVAAEDARRALIQFNLSSIPAGSTINSVSLRLSVIRTNAASARPMTLHRLLGEWGEGTTVDADRPNGGSGGPAANGDATWIHQFRPGDLWSTAGGDFNVAASASTNVPTSGAFTWNTSSGLVADVLGWVNNPTSNFGWLIKDAENTAGTARRFASRENSVANNRPLLTIDFTPPPARTPGDINNDGIVDVADVALLASNYGATTTANNFDLGEFSGDGIIGLADLAVLHRNLSPLASASPATVPEPSSVSLVVLAGAIGLAVRNRRLRFRE